MFKFAEIVLCFLFLILCHVSYGQVFRNKPSPTPYHDWDYLMFSQRWPITACAQWEESKNGNTCNLPKNKSLWSIHGIWPTKTGMEGPLFCPSAIHFNPDELQPMIDDLKTYWVNVEANTKPNSFWAHEWNKHGTCASTLPQLDSVTNYFKMGLKLTKIYDLSRVLANGGILPNSNGYDISVIYNVIKNTIKKEPIIQCVVDKKTKQSFISEIRICFNKTLELIDCDATNPIHRARVGIDTNCSQKKLVWYLANVPSMANSYDTDYDTDVPLEVQEHYQRQQRYTRFYKFVKFLSWFTL